MPFQLEPTLALVRADACRVLIADAVGLGKTVQAGLVVAETLARRPDARTLVIAPASLREQWQEELARRFRIGADLFDAAGIARVASQLPADVNPWSTRPVVIASIDFVKRPEIARALETLTWDLVIFDEAHHLTGRSDRALIAGAIASRARVLVLLTATPHSGDDVAFHRLCRLGRLNDTSPLLVFRRTRHDVGLPHARRDTLLRIRPTAAEADMHAALVAYTRLVWTRSGDRGGTGAQLAMSVLARRACSSATSLARSLERRLTLLADDTSRPDAQGELPFMATALDDAEPGAVLGAPGLADANEERRHLRRLLLLAQRASAAESKRSALKRFIRRVGEPVVVFTEYRDTLRELAATLSDIDAVELHGGLTAHERGHALARFTEGDARVLLATDTASEGLNLHHRCRTVVNLELPWTPLRLEQRAGRVDRIGQSRTVHIVRFVGTGTVEETTLVRLMSRLARIDEAMHVVSRAPDERRVAESILGDRPIADQEIAPAIGTPGTSTVDLRHEAEEEARRIADVRALLDPDPQTPTETRGVVARLHRRRGRSSQRCIWAFRITVSAASGHIVLEPLVLLTAEVPGLSVPGLSGRRDARPYLAHDHPAVTGVLRTAQKALLAELRDALRRPLALGSDRERELMTHLRDRRARLSASLLQGSLFDRRHERLALSQAALLDDALARCARRAEELETLTDVDVECCRLVFAAVVE